MKKSIFGTCLLLALPALAMEPSINAVEKKVFYSSSPTLTVSITEYDAGKAFLALSLNYDTEKMRAEYETLVARNAGLAPVGIAPRALADFEVSIPSIRFVQNATPLPSQYGPYADWSAMLTASQLKTLRASLRGGSLASVFRVKAPVEVSYEKATVSEEIKLPGSVCGLLLGKAQDLQTMIMNLAEYQPKVTARETTTIKDLKKNVLTECFDIAARGPVEDMGKLLETKLVAKNPVSLVGRSYKSTSTTETFNQNYDIVVKE